MGMYEIYIPDSCHITQDPSKVLSMSTINLGLSKWRCDRVHYRSGYRTINMLNMWLVSWASFKLAPGDKSPKHDLDFLWKFCKLEIKSVIQFSEIISPAAFEEGGEGHFF